MIEHCHIYPVFEELYLPLWWPICIIMPWFIHHPFLWNNKSTAFLSPPLRCLWLWLIVLICISWLLARTKCNSSNVTSPHCLRHQNPCPCSLSSLLLCAAECILVIFCVVCFGSSSVSHQGHLMAGCFLAHWCCLLMAEPGTLTLSCSPAVCITVPQMTAILYSLYFTHREIYKRF